MFVADVLELLLGDLREVFLMLLVELRPFVLMQSLLSASKTSSLAFLVSPVNVFLLLFRRPTMSCHSLLFHFKSV